MAVCWKCKADYFPHVKVCPACDQPLDEAPPEQDPVPREFVTVMSGGMAVVAVAQATLEAAGIPTLVLEENAAAMIWAPLGSGMRLQVPDTQVEAALEVLRKKPSDQGT